MNSKKVPRKYTGSVKFLYGSGSSSSDPCPDKTVLDPTHLLAIVNEFNFLIDYIINDQFKPIVQ